MNIFSSSEFPNHIQPAKAVNADRNRAMNAVTIFKSGRKTERERDKRKAFGLKTPSAHTPQTFYSAYRICNIKLNKFDIMNLLLLLLLCVSGRELFSYCNCL